MIRYLALCALVAGLYAWQPSGWTAIGMALVLPVAIVYFPVSSKASADRRSREAASPTGERG